MAKKPNGQNKPSESEYTPLLADDNNNLSSSSSSSLVNKPIARPAMSAVDRTLSAAVAKPYRGDELGDYEPTYDENGYLDFNSEDITHPHNWARSRRWYLTLVCIFIVLNGVFASSVPAGCVGSMQEHFGVSEIEANLTVTLFVLGYATGPFIFAPLSENFGRRWILYITFTMYMVLNFMTAFPLNWSTMLAGRALAGIAVSASLSNAPGVLSDLWDDFDRGDANALFGASLWVGPALGPIVAGAFELYPDYGWQWAFYSILWFGAPAWLLMFTIPETHAPTILKYKADKLRTATGKENIMTADEDGQHSLLQLYWEALTRPWFLLFDPISFCCSVYMCVVYTLQYMLFSIYPIVFQQMRGWDVFKGQLPLLGTVVGAFVGSVLIFLDTLRRKNAWRAGKVLPPEDRMIMAMPGGICFAIFMFWFAWSGNFNSVHWMVPTVAGGCLATSMMLIFIGYINYIVDTYGPLTASAVAVNTFARSAGGASAPMFTTQMFNALGVGGGGSLIGGVATVLAAIPFVFYFYGKHIRIRSKYVPTNIKGVTAQDEEAAT